MSEHMDRTIADLQNHLGHLEEQVADTKKTINSLCRMAGRPLLFDDVEVAQRAASGPLKGDEYYGHAFQTVVRMILESRKATGAGPATVNEIYASMIAGGYVFEAKDDENAKRGLRISLGKSSSVFHKLPNGKYGLLLWYPAVKQPKANGAKSAAADSDGDDEFLFDTTGIEVPDSEVTEPEKELVGAGAKSELPAKPR